MEQETKDEPMFITRSYIKYKYLKEFKEHDFDLESKTLITLNIDEEHEKNKAPYLVLFMKETNQNSKKYLEQFLNLAMQIKDDKCEIAFVNLEFEEKVLENFKKLGTKDCMDHPYCWARFTETPFIMVYRDGWPQGFYNGSVNPKNMSDFCTDVVSVIGSKVSKEHDERSYLTDQVFFNEGNMVNKEQVEEKKPKKVTDFKNQQVVNNLIF